MILSDGDMLQYKAIRAGTMADYIIKLDNYVTKNAPADTMGEVLKKSRYHK